ncbi:MAG: hypothetical protein Rubg2KO_23820 [Rubricoccaceae bacterium]
MLMTDRPLFPFIAALMVACAGIAAGVTLFLDGSDEAKQARLEAAAMDLAMDAITWAGKPTLMGGGQGSDALNEVSLRALGETPHTDEEGEFAVAVNATLRFRAIDTDLPYVEAAHASGEPVVRVAIYGPEASCLKLITQDAAVDTRPDGCSSW